MPWISIAPTSYAQRRSGLLREGTGPQVNAALHALLSDRSELVRAAAVPLFRQVDQQTKLALLAPLLSDPSRQVRHAAAIELAGGDLAALDAPTREALTKALGEYMDSRLANADMPEAHMALAGLALSMRKWEEAESAFNQAGKIDPQLEQAWLTLARLRAALGDEAGAEAYLQKGLQYLPQGIGLLFERAALETRARQRRARHRLVPPDHRCRLRQRRCLAWPGRRGLAQPPAGTGHRCGRQGNRIGARLG